MACEGKFEPSDLDNKVLWIFIDESGDFNFTSRGSEFFILTSLWTYRPVDVAGDLIALRYGFLERGMDKARFHAPVDGWDTRNSVYSILAGHSCYKIASIVVRKNRTNPSLRIPERFYPSMMKFLLKFILKGDVRHRYQRVVIITDRPPSKHIGRVIKGSLKLVYPQYAPAGIPMDLFQQESSSHSCLQAVDYCCWAIKRKWGNNDERMYKQAVSPRMDQDELDIFRFGTTDYY